MTLKDDFVRSGNWFFRWRSFLPLIFIGIILIAMREYQYPGRSEAFDHIWEIVCLFISFIGLTIRILTVGHTPRRTSGRNTKKQIADQLNTTGMYSIVRNPLYLGNFFMGLGVVLFVHLWWLTLIYILVFWLYYERIIFAEEEFLKRKFGDKYLNWVQKTPVFFPNFKLYIKPELPFSLRIVLKREYNGFFAVISIMFVLEIAGEMVIHGKPDFDLGWIILVSFGFLVWIILRSLKKYTKVLDVKGRK